MTDPNPVCRVAGFFPELEREPFEPTLRPPANVRCGGCGHLRAFPQSFRAPGTKIIHDVCGSCQGGRRGPPRAHIPHGAEVIKGVRAADVERYVGRAR